jgi:hypothetical protein
MHHKITLILTAVILMLGGTTFVPPDAAAAAETYNVSDCVPVDELDLEFCYTSKGMAQVNESASGGHTIYAYNGLFCYAYTDSQGTVVQDDCQRFHQENIIVDGNEQVSFTLFGGKQTVLGETCTYDYSVVFANGKERHTVDNFSCV